jgi:predicted amidophosphoribosyltransferase
MENSILTYHTGKGCKRCGRMLPDTYEEEYCPFCRETMLFDKVRDYVRSADVTEYQVASHFNIPVEKVRYWIKEGRIEYKDDNVKGEGGPSGITGMYCSRCGAPVTFGTLCTKCLKLLNENRKGYSPVQKKKENERMRFLEKNGENGGNGEK